MFLTAKIQRSGYNAKSFISFFTLKDFQFRKFVYLCSCLHSNAETKADEWGYIYGKVSAMALCL